MLVKEKICDRCPYVRSNIGIYSPLDELISMIEGMSSGLGMGCLLDMDKPFHEQCECKAYLAFIYCIGLEQYSDSFRYMIETNQITKDELSKVDCPESIMEFLLHHGTEGLSEELVTNHLKLHYENIYSWLKQRNNV